MISVLVAGALTGLLAGKLLEGTPFGSLKDVAIGTLGAIGAWLLVGLLGFSPVNMFGDIVTGFAGAMLFRFGPQPTDTEEQPS